LGQHITIGTITITWRPWQDLRRWQDFRRSQDEGQPSKLKKKIWWAGGNLEERKIIWRPLKKLS